MIQFKNVSKNYDEKVVFKDFSYQFEDHETYVITGVSGKGKTTLLNLMMGLVSPDEGEIICEGTFSTAFQQTRLLEGYSILKNLQLFTDLPVKEIEEIVKEVVGVDPNQRVSSLSAGQKQRDSLLRALLNESDILLLDEPFTGLDSQTGKLMMETIKQYQNNRLLVIVTHDKEPLGSTQYTEISL